VSELVVFEESEELEVVLELGELLFTDGLESEVVSLLVDDSVAFDQECAAGADEPDIAPLSLLAGAEAAAPESPEDGLDVL